MFVKSLSAGGLFTSFSIIPKLIKPGEPENVHGKMIKDIAHWRVSRVEINEARQAATS